MTDGVSVVLLSYNRPAFLEVALASVLAQRPAPADVLVVDNPSPSSPDVDRIVAAAPGVRLVRPARNLGFAGGMNAGLAAARERWVLLTEDDIVLRAGCLAALHACAAGNPRAGVCAPLTLNRGTGTVRSAGCAVRLEGVFRQESLGAGAADPAPFLAGGVVDFAAGSALFGDRERLLRLGAFRAGFFMYFEDLDLGLRLRRAGLDVVMAPGAVVEHFEPVPGPDPPDLEFHRAKNMLTVYALHARLGVWPEFAVRYGVLQPLRILWSDPRRARDVARAWWWLARHVPALVRDRRALGARVGELV